MLYFETDEADAYDEIIATHAPADQKAEFDVNGLLQMVRQTQAREQMGVIDNTHTSVIERICSEIFYKATSNEELPHETAISVLEAVQEYSWDAKLVLAIAAFVSNHGIFYLLIQLYEQDIYIINILATMRRFPSIIRNQNELEAYLKLFKDLKDKMIIVADLVLEFNKLPPINTSALLEANRQIPLVLYLVIRIIVASATMFDILTTLGPSRWLTEQKEELSRFITMLDGKYEILNEKKKSCWLHIKAKQNDEEYLKLVNHFDTSREMESLKALIKAKDDTFPLWDGTKKGNTSVDALRNKIVLLLISDLSISRDELEVFKMIYGESRVAFQNRRYAVVWIPIINTKMQLHDQELEKQLHDLRTNMPWYSLLNPLTEQIPLRLIREVWHFRNNKTSLVALDDRGRVFSLHASHMMWIWQTKAFPFTWSREEFLWENITWRLDWLVDVLDQFKSKTDPSILSWIREEKYIFLYGGDNVEWAREFTKKARNFAGEAKIEVKMVYMGKRSERDKVKEVMETVKKDGLSSWFEDFAMIWFFWRRIESMLFSLYELGKTGDQYEQILQGIKELLSYEEQGGWAMLSHGSNIVVSGVSTTILPVFEYDKWKHNTLADGFDLSLKGCHENEKLRVQGDVHPCCRFNFRSYTRRIPHDMICPSCSRSMEKLITFFCPLSQCRV